jgi:hypothetical protein
LRVDVRHPLREGRDRVFVGLVDEDPSHLLVDLGT